MAFRQQQRPRSARQVSYHEPAPINTTSSQANRPLEESEEWILFSPAAPSTTARTHTTSTERTTRTAGLSRFSDFGSLDTAARSEPDEDDALDRVTEGGEDLDSLDDGLYAFHEPSDFAGPTSKLQQSGDTVLPTHDGLGTFQPDADVQEHMWQFERPAPRRRPARRRSSIQRRFDALDETEELSQEQERRQRIEKWRLEQSKALIEEIERETRRRRRMSMVSAAKSRTDSATHDVARSLSQAAASMSDGQSEASDESTEGLSFWQRLTRRVIRDLMGIDEDTLSVIFGESLPEDAMLTPLNPSEIRPSIDATLREFDGESLSDDAWQTRLLERVARELGILVNQLSEHPGAFSTYRLTQEPPPYAGLPSTQSPPSISASASANPSPLATAAAASASSTASAHFAPSFPAQQQQPSATYSEASLWGIEEEPEPVDPLSSFRAAAARPVNQAEEAARDQEYWEQELDVKMVFQFLVKRFSSRRPSTSSPSPSSTATPARRHPAQTPPAAGTEADFATSARRAAIIRQHHPLVNRSKERALPTRSSAKSTPQQQPSQQQSVFKTHYSPPAAASRRKSLVLRSSETSCASQSTRKSKRSSAASGRVGPAGGNNNGGNGAGGAAGRNYWDMSGSVGSGSVIAGEV